MTDAPHEPADHEDGHDDSDDTGPRPPDELLTDPDRQLHDLVGDRIEAYVELARTAAQAWEQGRYDASRWLQDVSSFTSLVTRDLLHLWSVPFGGAPGFDAFGRGAASSATGARPSPATATADAVVRPSTRSVTLCCSPLVHVRTGDVVPAHAVSLDPNPLPAGQGLVRVRFDSFGKVAGPYKGTLHVRTDHGPGTVLGDVVVYVGGGNQRF